MKNLHNIIFSYLDIIWVFEGKYIRLFFLIGFYYYLTPIIYKVNLAFISSIIFSRSLSNVSIKLSNIFFQYTWHQEKVLHTMSSKCHCKENWDFFHHFVTSSPLKFLPKLSFVCFTHSYNQSHIEKKTELVLLRKLSW